MWLCEDMKNSVFCSHLVNIFMSFQDVEIQGGGICMELQYSDWVFLMKSSPTSRTGSFISTNGRRGEFLLYDRWYHWSLITEWSSYPILYTNKNCRVQEQKYVPSNKKKWKFFFWRINSSLSWEACIPITIAAFFARFH